MTIEEMTPHLMSKSISKGTASSLRSDDLPSPGCSYEGKAPINDGYHQNEFIGKGAQITAVSENIISLGFIPKDLVLPEVEWFYENLGIDDLYFQLESIDTISKHIMALYAAKLSCYVKRCETLDVNLEQEEDDRAVYIHNSKPGVSNLDGPNYERKIDEKYLDHHHSTPSKSFRLETYRSSGTVSSSHKTQLRCYFISQCDFVESSPQGQDVYNIQKVSDRVFLGKATKTTLDIYSNVIHQVLNNTGPVIEMFEVGEECVPRTKRLIIGYRQGTCKTFFSSLSHLYHYYGLYSTRKYVENFSNGVSIICLYLAPLSTSRFPPIEQSVIQIMKEASLIYCLPSSPLQQFFAKGMLSVQETIYGYSALAFAQHFLNRLGSEYTTLSNILDLDKSTHLDVLLRLKKRLRQETFTREYILDIVKSYPELIRILYVNFAMSQYYPITHLHDELQTERGGIEGIFFQSYDDIVGSLSFQRLKQERSLSEPEILEKIRKTTANQHELMVFEAFLTFNRHVLKTNFYRPTKVALSFRLDPAFLPATEYPEKPYGMFLVIGSEFRGFHVRFRDVARGGIRIIKSRNRESYSINLRSLFDENYALASTQHRKNKDIPEGGSKGTILLDADQQDKPKEAFQKYVDAVLDILLPPKEKMVDLYGKEEILFFGPDEGTAEYMDWASQHARKRGASFWNAFTTGKSPSLGGIPHDTFGMTTRSIHKYVTGIYAKLGLIENEVTKIQTGGPDGDLGSNEIKISKDRTIGVVDGSGVLYDPQGLNRSELLKLANARKMISNFDTSLLGPQGFRVLVDENDVTLRDGHLIESGLVFRNEFHLCPYAKADLFVPCGGRPEAIDIQNVQQAISNWKYIVEGANLFITQEARVQMERAGVIIFKDASANKGGVTSSSLEVLAALSLSDEEFIKHMMLKESDFYDRYVRQVQKTIEDNASLEFECLWREHDRTGRPRSALSDALSLAVVKMNNELTGLGGDELYAKLGERVLERYAVPSMLLDLIGGIKVFRTRVPMNYQRAIFSSWVASRFVYEFGIEPPQFAFFTFMSKI